MTSLRNTVYAVISLVTLAGCNPYEGVAARNEAAKIKQAELQAEQQKLDAEAARKARVEAEWEQLRYEARRGNPTPRTPLSDGTRFEPRADTHGMEDDVIKFFIAQVVGSGYRCDTISNIRPMITKRGVELICNKYAYTYEIEDRGGRWTVTVD